ncbi:hypothetical protein SODALDRAFT_328936 [Sodiomyces alkalinus F11]|uniref:GCN5-related N-acetyltransferase Rv2170-like domain-containing protein n=1 Tax=Sodiomyces alkalinus (strain CBS 110278 / VKM F-3762 / F11) TaxID=1314773 RepID=A0A3N2PMC0_SODAK|nr:hypothetical protein SODALDRAFT_328936 [Sodiomyces alkalinus F11]ROT35570.1 hypothetical protein SODALDRAFT_328936 [Sodiomyces alkalinus F11]
MVHEAFVCTAVPDGLNNLLTSHLPASLPLLRRLQSTSFPGGSTPSSRVLVATDDPIQGIGQPGSPEQNHTICRTPRHFTAAYLDLSRGPETNMWIYSTLEDALNDSASPALPPDEVALAEAQILSVLHGVRRLVHEHDAPLAYPSAVLIGTINNHVRQIIRARAPGFSITERGDYDKFLFRVVELPSADVALPEGMRYGRPTLDNCHVVKARTHIPREVKTLLALSGMVIRLRDGTPIAWAFLAPDGSLASLHCEDPYRRRGLASAVAVKLLRERTTEYGTDGWGSADVAADNASSQAVCRSLNGKSSWVVSWILLHTEEEK